MTNNRQVKPLPADQVQVAVGVLYDAQHRLLLAKRPECAHQGGLWEFPGGKIQARESVLAALVREFAEEVSVSVRSARPLIVVEHDYGDKQVRLDVWFIDDFAGVARGVEGQEVRWVHWTELSDYAFPAANQPIIEALQQVDGFS